ncbi:unnamed protein product [Mycena citricolor]|uniref:DUF6534 domain-containing protein n=1 Tax=Mycena citricolor TaxID=2018698 RepID=A0AAD2HED4_9AGAR|nr:unnamed protein product [Mycena citricolor]
MSTNINATPTASLSPGASSLPGLPKDFLMATYGAWLIGLFLETILYGSGLLQTWLYFIWWPMDGWEIKGPVLTVFCLETAQVLLFFRSTCVRFIDNFGTYQETLIWSDSSQLLANASPLLCRTHLNDLATVSFLVFGSTVSSSISPRRPSLTSASYFASRLYRLTAEGVRLYRPARWGIHVIVFLALLQVAAGIAQTIVSWRVHFYAKLDSTKAVTTLQTAASFACDVGITVYLCIFLSQNKGGVLMKRTRHLLNTLIMNAINRGMLTALASALTMILFLALPDTFWFFLSMAPSSKLYMNSMLATLNMRQYIRQSINPGHTVNLSDIANLPLDPASTVSAVEFCHPSETDPDMARKSVLYYSSELSLAAVKHCSDSESTNTVQESDSMSRGNVHSA